eukprot:1602926-Rhodomonas_salina.1
MHVAVSPVAQRSCAQFSVSDDVSPAVWPAPAVSKHSGAQYPVVPYVCRQGMTSPTIPALPKSTMRMSSKLMRMSTLSGLI